MSFNFDIGVPSRRLREEESRSPPTVPLYPPENWRGEKKCDERFFSHSLNFHIFHFFFGVSHELSLETSSDGVAKVYVAITELFSNRCENISWKRKRESFRSHTGDTLMQVEGRGIRWKSLDAARHARVIVSLFGCV